MKIRFYPKTEAVRNVLVDRVKAKQKDLDVAEARVAEAEGRKIQFGSDVQSLKLLVEVESEALSDLKSQLSLLESHGPPEVMCEIDL